MPNDLFQSFQCQLQRSGTFQAGHSVLAAERVTFQSCRRDALDALAALWSYRAPSFLLAGTSRSYLPSNFDHESKFWHDERGFWIVLVNCEYLLLRNTMEWIGYGGQDIQNLKPKKSPRTKTNYKRLSVCNCNYSIAHSVTCKHWQFVVSETRPIQKWPKTDEQ